VICKAREDQVRIPAREALAEIQRALEPIRDGFVAVRLLVLSR